MTVGISVCLVWFADRFVGVEGRHVATLVPVASRTKSKKTRDSSAEMVAVAEVVSQVKAAVNRPGFRSVLYVKMEHYESEVLA